jgi:hypothetical protein
VRRICSFVRPVRRRPLNYLYGKACELQPRPRKKASKFLRTETRIEYAYWAASLRDRKKWTKRLRMAAVESKQRGRGDLVSVTTLTSTLVLSCIKHVFPLRCLVRGFLVNLCLSHCQCVPHRECSIQPAMSEQKGVSTRYLAVQLGGRQQHGMMCQTPRDDTGCS